MTFIETSAPSVFLSVIQPVLFIFVINECLFNFDDYFIRAIRHLKLFEKHKIFH